MSYLINRNPPARPVCLHAICQFTATKFSTDQIFNMKDIKFDQNSLNIHNFCKILEKHNSIKDLNYCPYKENPLDESGCALTNGVYVDSTKQKEVSNTINALHSLGLFERRNKEIRLTNLGLRFAKSEINSETFLSIFKESILKNGLMIGLLGQIYIENKKSFKTEDIFVGYPNTGKEYVNHDDERIIISSGSEKDSNTRTKSCLLAWGTWLNFFYPKDLKNTPIADKRNYVLQKNRNRRDYLIDEFPFFIFEKEFITEKPLDYNNLTKLTRALRENNQQNIRKVTLEVEPKIKNRRLALLHSLNDAYKKNRLLNIKNLITKMRSFPDQFIVDEQNFEDIMFEEIKIGFAAGIPFRVIDDSNVRPLCGLNMQELNLNAPNKTLKIIKQILS